MIITIINSFSRGDPRKIKIMGIFTRKNVFEIRMVLFSIKFENFGKMFNLARFFCQNFIKSYQAIV